MAHGKNAEHHLDREYWSRRYSGMWSWGPFAKLLTHKRERASAKIMERKFKRNPEAWNDT